MSPITRTWGADCTVEAFHGAFSLAVMQPAHTSQRITLITLGVSKLKSRTRPGC